jgi:hypothetical protein
MAIVSCPTPRRRGAAPLRAIVALDDHLADDFAGTPFCQSNFYGARTKRLGRDYVRISAPRLAIYRRSFGLESDRILLSEAHSADWQSLTFTGEQHRLLLNLVGADAETACLRLTDSLEDTEFSLRVISSRIFGPRASRGPMIVRSSSRWRR